jgi:transposase
MIPMHIEATYLPHCSDLAVAVSVYIALCLVPRLVIMAPALTECQLELARHCFRYNDSTTYYLNKLSTQEVADTVQCSVHTIRRLKNLWQKTGDVEKLRGRAGRQKSLDDYMEQALVEIFLQNVDITMEEALEWLEEEFKRNISRMTLSRLLRRNNVTYKRLKFVAAQRNPTLRADYLMRVEDFYDDQLVFLDESAANEFTKDRKFGWSMVGYPAVKERDLRRSERWSILPAYTIGGYMAWKIFKGSYTKQIFNDFVYTEVLPRMNAYSEERPPPIRPSYGQRKNPLLRGIARDVQRRRGAIDLFPPLLAGL